MERIERHEGETLELGGYSFAIVSARSGRLIMLANSGMGETREDCLREARKLRARIDKITKSEQNLG